MFKGFYNLEKVYQRVLTGRCDAARTCDFK